MEKRRAERRRLRVPVRLEPGGLTSSTGDLSTSGLFIRTARVFRPGSRVQIILITPEGPLSGWGVVRWAKRVPSDLLLHLKGGMGIELTGACPELRDYLDDLFPRFLEAAAG